MADVVDRLASGTSNETKGIVLAISSSIFIGSSFIIKKKGLRIASATGIRAGAGGFGYLKEPVWWAGLLFMVVGELANFAAYAFTPAIVVTPMGALSIIVSAILAHTLLKEKLNVFGILGCLLCIVGSFTIVLHAPTERQISTVREITVLVLQPGFIAYALLAIGSTLTLIFVVAPEHGQNNLSVYIGICSLMGSLSVMSCKSLGIAIKLTLDGNNQFIYPETYVSAMVVTICVVTQMNYLNKALDTFNTAIVSPVYYVMFTTLTIVASMTLFQDAQTIQQVATELCGFTTIVAGTFLLHTTKDMEVTLSELLSLRPRDLCSPAPIERAAEDGLVSAEYRLQMDGSGIPEQAALLSRSKYIRPSPS